ncbi:MAG: RHS repeat-associated core domain-containing protein, partial [Bacilli bacterium]|nr:RHS repeat-associated core domain-containing protein [Bacilli bacterium]
DKETGLYLLKTRCYNSEWGRFITKDTIDYLEPDKVYGLNLYAYCMNDPINYSQTPIGSWLLPIKSSNGKNSIFNKILASGSFRKALFFGNGIITAFYANGSANAKINSKEGNFEIGAYGNFSLLNANGQIGIGNEKFNVSLVSVVDIITISGMLGIKINEDEHEYFAGIDATIAALTASAGVKVEFLGAQIEVECSVKALSASFKFGIEIRNGEIRYKSGFALLFGYDIYITFKIA